MAVRITETLVKTAPAPERGSRITYDTDLKGFGLRVTAAGARAFVLNYRANGVERRITIGSHPEQTATSARKRAEHLKREIDNGEDPLNARRVEREAPTVADLCQLYEEQHLPRKRPSSQRDDKATIAKIVRPRLGKLKVAALQHTDIAALHREITKRAPYRANRTLALVSKMLTIAVKEGWRTDNPARHVERNPEEQRERHLDAPELGRLLAALNAYAAQDVANAVRLLLVTGARRGEVLSARWEHFDLTAGVWTKPKENTKQKRTHRVRLNSYALRMLIAMKSVAGNNPYLFPSHGAAGHIVAISHAWTRIAKEANLDNVRIHDLRHTFASIIASSGTSLHFVGSLLGHTQVQTTKRYAHLDDDPLLAASEIVSNRLLQIEGEAS